MGFSASELTYLRSQKPRTAIIRWYLAVAPYGETDLFTAQVNDAAIERGEMSITYDGATGEADAEIWMTLWVGSTPGAFDKGMVRIRDIDTVANIIEVAENDDIDWADDDYLTIPGECGFREIWGKYQRLDEETGTTYKDYDRAWGDGNYTENMRPKANAGPPAVKFLNDDGYVDIEFIGEDSYAVKVGENIASWSWEFRDGVVQSGGANQEGTRVNPNVVRYSTTGMRYVYLQVTDTNGRTMTHYVPIWTFDEDEMPYTQVEVQELACDDNGWCARLKCFQTNTTEEDIIHSFPDGALCVLFTETEYGGTETSICGFQDREEVEFVGWIKGETLDFNFEEGSVEFEAVSTDGILRSIPGFAFRITNDDTPTNWEEMLHLNVDRAQAMLLQWHCTVNSIAHINRVGEDRRIAIQDFPRGSIFEQLNDHLLNDAQCRIMTDRQGIMWATKDPQFMEAADRDAVDVACTLTEPDWLGRIEERRSHWPKVGYVMLGGMDATLTDDGFPQAYLSQAPGRCPSRSNDEIREEGYIVEDQDELNWWSGMRYAKENCDYPDLPVDLVGFWPGFDPAYQRYVKLTTEDPLGRNDWNQERFIVRGVAHQVLPRDLTALTELTLEHETMDVGEGETVDIPDLNEYHTPMHTPNITTPDPPSHTWTPDSLQGVGAAVAITAREVALTTGLLPEGLDEWPLDMFGFPTGPTWVDITPGAANIPIMAFRYIHVDEDTIGGWLMTYNQVFICNDLMATPVVWTDTNIPTVIGTGWPDNTIMYNAAIRNLVSNPDWAYVVQGYPSYNEIYAYYTDDRGANWHASTFNCADAARNCSWVGYEQVAMDPVGGEMWLFCADQGVLNNQYCGGAVYGAELRSLDLGVNTLLYQWDPALHAARGIPCKMRQVLMDRQLAYMISGWHGAGRLYRSEDRCASWQDVTPPNTDRVYDFFTATYAVDEITIATRDSVSSRWELHFSDDRGDTWSLLADVATNIWNDGQVDPQHWLPCIGGWPGDEDIIWIGPHYRIEGATCPAPAGCVDNNSAAWAWYYTPDHGANWYTLNGNWYTVFGRYSGTGIAHWFPICEPQMNHYITPLPRIGENA